MNNKIFFVFLFFVSSIFSQTKVETENYILSKLNLYAVSEENKSFNDYLYYRKPTFKFDGINLIINSFFSEDIFIINGNLNYTFPVWAIIKLDIYESKDYNEEKIYKLRFYLNDFCKDCRMKKTWEQSGQKIVYYKEHSKKYGFPITKSKKILTKIYTNKNESNNELKYVTVNLTKQYPEEDFVGRLQRAIDHLKTMYPKKPGSTDLFDKDKVQNKKEY